MRLNVYVYIIIVIVIMIVWSLSASISLCQLLQQVAVDNLVVLVTYTLLFSYLCNLYIIMCGFITLLTVDLTNNALAWRQLVCTVSWGNKRNYY